MEEHPTTEIDPPITIMEARAQAMFDRVLVNWASDLLELRRRGLNTPGWRVEDGEDGLRWRRAA